MNSEIMEPAMNRITMDSQICRCFVPAGLVDMSPYNVVERPAMHASIGLAQEDPR